MTQMDASGTSHSCQGLGLTKVASVVACVFFVPAIALMPGIGSSLGMPWPVFFCTWGVMLVSAFISFVGYFSCRRRGQQMSVFYAICPALLFVAFLLVLNLRDIVRALTL